MTIRFSKDEICDMMFREAEHILDKMEEDGREVPGDVLEASIFESEEGEMIYEISVISPKK